METPDQLTPDAGRRAEVRIRRVTRAAVLGATGAGVLIGVVVAQEHPGSSSTSHADTTTSSGSSTSDGSTHTSTATTPTRTTTTPMVVSGGSSR